MVGPYKKRRGLGKCETNQILMNHAVPRADSGGFPTAENTKAFVIQNLFRRTEKPGRAEEIFFNYSLDINLSPKRRTVLAEPVDNRLQVTENKRRFLRDPAVAKKG